MVGSNTGHLIAPERGCGDWGMALEDRQQQLGGVGGPLCVCGGGQGGSLESLQFCLDEVKFGSELRCDSVGNLANRNHNRAANTNQRTAAGQTGCT